MSTSNRNSAQGTPPPRTTEGADRVLVALRRIIRATDQQSKRLGREVGLTIPQIVALRAIDSLGEVTAGELSRRVSLSQATLTNILDRLESRGLIERYRSRSDRRIVHTALTARGREVLDAAPPLLHERFSTAFAALTATDRSRIIAALESVAELMGTDEVEPTPILDTEPDPDPSASAKT